MNISFFHWLFSLFSEKSNPQQQVNILVVGIGNKGTEYHNTRHNIGFDVADALLPVLKKQQHLNAYEAEITVGTIESNQGIAIAKPQTYVNRSGVSVQALMKAYNVGIESLLVIVDDFHLPFSTIRLRRNGSDGGHNGLKSIISEIGDGFPRLRCGIGPVPKNVSIIDFVLGKFSDQEELKKSAYIQHAVDAVKYFCTDGIEAAMNRFNK